MLQVVRHRHHQESVIIQSPVLMRYYTEVGKLKNRSATPSIMSRTPVS